ncbi:DUF305 domain-containing protein [Pontibacter roseus]|uniref:DUF305 domain-containing protein n=1 Tax=Pontibacter roseus TaxID=336989 RepID=UPI001461556A|nr:DUF305 domain-containing protein [Pontibacter roseus]
MVVAVFVFSSCENGQDVVSPLSASAEQAAKGPYWEDDKAFDKEMQQIINSMMKMMNQMEMREDMMAMMHCMRSVKDTPDPDVDFAQLMICHHEGALAMSNTGLKWGNDEMALEEAEIIIEEQAQEIMELAAFLNEHGIPTKHHNM